VLRAYVFTQKDCAGQAKGADFVSETGLGAGRGGAQICTLKSEY